MTVLSKLSIMSRLDSGEIVVSPAPPEPSVGQGTIDLRIGNLFLHSMSSSVGMLNVSRPAEGARLFSELYVRPGNPFILQPKQFALASTLEYVALPSNVAGLLQSRSTYGRMGLVSEAAAWVSPGYRGSPTLELYNSADVALAVEAGTAICQLILMTSEDGPLIRSRYHCHTRPYFAQAIVDEWLDSVDVAIADSVRRLEAS